MREVQEDKMAVDTTKSTVESQLYQAKMFINKGKDTSRFKERILCFNWQLDAQN